MLVSEIVASIILCSCGGCGCVAYWLYYLIANRDLRKQLRDLPKNNGFLN